MISMYIIKCFEVISFCEDAFVLIDYYLQTMFNEGGGGDVSFAHIFFSLSDTK